MAPASIHRSGRTYEWELSHHPAETTLADAPEWLLDLMEGKQTGVSSSLEKNGRAPKINGPISKGTRNQVLTSLAGSMRHRGMERDAILAALTVENESKCLPPLSAEEVAAIADSVSRYAPGEEQQEDSQELDKIQALLKELASISEGDRVNFCNLKILPKMKSLMPSNQEVIINEIAKILKPLGIGKPAIRKTANIILHQADGQIGEKRVSIKDESPYFQDDEFIPKRLADDIMLQKRFIYSGEQLKLYSNGVYDQDGDMVVRELSLKLLNENFKKRRYEETHFIIETLSIKKPGELNPNIYLINIKNGMYDIPNKALLPHDSKYLSTIQLNCHYNTEAKCPKFIVFLNATLSPDNIRLLQEITGYLLIPVTKSQKAFLIYGPGGSGKSTFLSVLINLLGQINCSAVSLQDLTDRFRASNLFGKLANVCSDIPSKPIEDAAIFKGIVGEDTILAERKFKNPFEFKPFARLLFSANQLPRTIDKTSAFFRRWIIVGFNNVIPEGERDPLLKEKLSEELDGIFLWALQGLERLIKNNFVFSETTESKELLELYKRESSSVLTFIEDQCIIRPNVRVDRSQLYSEYKTWCQDNGFKPSSQRSFNNEIEANFKGKVWRDLRPINRIKVWRGLALSTREDEENDTTENKTETPLRSEDAFFDPNDKRW